MIKYYKPYITDKMKNAVSKSIDSGWLTQGKLVQKFEERFAELNGSKYAVAVSNATIGLTILAISHQKTIPKWGKKYIIPAYTFCATLQSFLNIGDVWICDILENYKISDKNKNFKDLLGEKIYKDCSVSFGGKIRDLYADIYDNAHRFPDKKNVGDQVFSFYANKPITTGEGGMICTNDKDIADECRKLRQHGRTKIGYKQNPTCFGYNAKMTDFQAVLGIEQLNIIEFLKTRRREIAEKYRNCFINTDLWFDDPDDHHYHLFVIRSDKRKQIEKALKKNGVEYSRHYKPLGSKKDFPNAWKIWKQSISLPIYPDLTDAQQDVIMRAVLSGLED